MKNKQEVYLGIPTTNNMAGVNTSTGKIVGCKPGTLTYKHESAHIIYDSSIVGIRNGILIEDFLSLTIFTIIISLFLPTLIWIKLIAAIFFLLLSLLKMYEEIWCWVWAIKKK